MTVYPYGDPSPYSCDCPSCQRYRYQQEGIARRERMRENIRLGNQDGIYRPGLFTDGYLTPAGTREAATRRLADALQNNPSSLGFTSNHVANCDTCQGEIQRANAAPGGHSPVSFGYIPPSRRPSLWTFATTSQPPLAEDRCGTVLGYRKHLDAGEPTCDPCREAERDDLMVDYRNGETQTGIDKWPLLFT